MDRGRLGDYLELRTSAVDWARMVQAMGSNLLGANFPGFDHGRALELARKMNAPRVVAAIQSMSGTLPMETVLKTAVAAGTVGDASWAGPLAPQNALGEQFVEYLRPMTILGRLPGLRTVPFNCRFGRVTTGTSASFVGDGKPIPCAALALDTPTLGVAKLAIIVPVTGELAANSSPDAARTIASDCASAVASGSDECFLDPDRAAVVGVSPQSITFGSTQIASTGTSTAQITADAKACMRALDAVRVPLRECVWIASQALFVHLATSLTGTTSEPVWDGVADGAPWIGGLPLFVSGSAFGAASASEAMLVLLHPQSIAIADSGTVQTDVSQEAAIQFSDAPAQGAQQLTSLYQSFLVAVRVQRFINWTLRRTGAVACVRSINI